MGKYRKSKEGTDFVFSRAHHCGLKGSQEGRNTECNTIWLKWRVEANCCDVVHIQKQSNNLKTEGEGHSPISKIPEDPQALGRWILKHWWKCVNEHIQMWLSGAHHAWSPVEKLLTAILLIPVVVRKWNAFLSSSNCIKELLGTLGCFSGIGKKSTALQPG